MMIKITPGLAKDETHYAYGPLALACASQLVRLSVFEVKRTVRSFSLFTFFIWHYFKNP